MKLGTSLEHFTRMKSFVSSNTFFTTPWRGKKLNYIYFFPLFFFEKGLPPPLQKLMIVTENLNFWRSLSQRYFHPGSQRHIPVLTYRRKPQIAATLFSNCQIEPRVKLNRAPFFEYALNKRLSKVIINPGRPWHIPSLPTHIEFPPTMQLSRLHRPIKYNFKEKSVFLKKVLESAHFYFFTLAAEDT